MASSKTKLAVVAAAGAVAAAAYLYHLRSKKKSGDTLVLRSAYKPSPYQVESIDLNFILTEEEAVTESKIKFVGSGVSTPLYLDGEDLELRSIAMDGVALRLGKDYVLGAEEGLTLLKPPGAGFVLTVTVATKPQDNLQLSGLYKTSGNYCTQCEAIGFRRITFYLDRPDVMSKFTVRVEAEKAKYPLLLSNGNETARGELTGGRHWASFEDPFKKPAYLFALIAASLEGIESSFTTMSGRKVPPRVYPVCTLLASRHTPTRAAAVSRCVPRRASRLGRTTVRREHVRASHVQQAGLARNIDVVGTSTQY